MPSYKNREQHNGSESRFEWQFRREEQKTEAIRGFYHTYCLKYVREPQNSIFNALNAVYEMRPVYESRDCPEGALRGWEECP